MSADTVPPLTLGGPELPRPYGQRPARSDRDQFQRLASRLVTTAAGSAALRSRLIVHYHSSMVSASPGVREGVRMSVQAMEQVLDRVMREPGFRAYILDNPVRALHDYDLTPEERTILLADDAGAREAHGLDQRVSKIHIF